MEEDSREVFSGEGDLEDITGLMGEREEGSEYWGWGAMMGRGRGSGFRGIDEGFCAFFCIRQ